MFLLQAVNMETLKKYRINFMNNHVSKMLDPVGFFYKLFHVPSTVISATLSGL